MAIFIGLSGNIINIDLDVNTNSSNYTFNDVIKKLKLTDNKHYDFVYNDKIIYNNEYEYVKTYNDCVIQIIKSPLQLLPWIDVNKINW